MSEGTKSIFESLRDVRIPVGYKKVDDEGNSYVTAEDFMNATYEAVIHNEKFRVELKGFIKKILL